MYFLKLNSEQFAKLPGKELYISPNLMDGVLRKPPVTFSILHKFVDRLFPRIYIWWVERTDEKNLRTNVYKIKKKKNCPATVIQMS